MVKRYIKFIIFLRTHWNFFFLRLSYYLFIRNYFCYERIFYFDKTKNLFFREVCYFLFKFAVVFWLLDLFHMINFNPCLVFKYENICFIINLNYYFLIFITVMRYIIVFIGFSWVGMRSLLLFCFFFSYEYYILSYEIGILFCLFIFLIDFFINFSLFLFIYYFV